MIRLTVLMLLGAFIVGCAVDPNEDEDAENEPTPQPTVLMKSEQFLTIRSNPDGSEDVRILGMEDTTFSPTSRENANQMALKQFEVFFFEYNDDESIDRFQLQAAEGMLNTETLSFEAYGDVVLIQEAEVRIESEVVLYNDETKLLTTPEDELVRIRRADGTLTTGYGLEIDRGNLDSGEMTLNRVTTITPNPGTDEFKSMDPDEEEEPSNPQATPAPRDPTPAGAQASEETVPNDRPARAPAPSR